MKPLPILLLFAPLASAQSWEACGSIHAYGGEVAGDSFGFIVRNAGDTDLDGVDDFVVGAVNSDVGGALSGRAYLYSGASGALRFDWHGIPGENLGYVANGAGDVNGDGRADVIVGGPDLSNATSGNAYLYSGLDGSVLWSGTGEAPGDRYGQVANGIGDIDGDGFDDFAVGAEFHSSQGPNRGRVYVYSGQTHALLRIHDGTLNNDMLGTGIATLCDRNGDGFDDYILGAAQGFTGRGKALVIDGATGAVQCTLLPPNTGASFGLYMLGCIGDVDGDGTPDFYVSDFNDSSSTGRVRVYDGVDCSMRYELTGEAAGDVFGAGSGRAGDVDGDGRPDLVFGALGASTQSRGQIHLFRGFDGAPLGTFTGELGNGNFGFSASGGDDLDGDGWPDYLVGSPNPNAAAGVVYVLSGRPQPPRTTCPGAVNSTGSACTMDTFRSLSLTTNEVRLRAFQAPPGEVGVFLYGRDRLVTPLGDGTLCIAAPIFRAGAPAPIGAGGKAILDLDVTQHPFHAGAGAIEAGETWQLQFWYRDSAGAAGSNLSNGVQLTWCD